MTEDWTDLSAPVTGAVPREGPTPLEARVDQTLVPLATEVDIAQLTPDEPLWLARLHTSFDRIDQSLDRIDQSLDRMMQELAECFRCECQRLVDMVEQFVIAWKARSEGRAE